MQTASADDKCCLHLVRSRLVQARRSLFYWAANIGQRYLCLLRAIAWVRSRRSLWWKVTFPNTDEFYIRF
ncbi:MAG: hypothetical protein ACYTXC_15860 [Nostoc sp.]